MNIRPWLADQFGSAQVEVYYYGYWVYDAGYDYYYWFPAEVVIVDNTWIEYV